MKELQEFNREFAYMMRILMHHRGMDVGTLAEASGMHSGKILHMLHGRQTSDMDDHRSIGLWQADRIATGLNVPLDLLCGWVDMSTLGGEPRRLVRYEENILASLPPVVD